jgi:hypothetical protein
MSDVGEESIWAPIKAAAYAAIHIAIHLSIAGLLVLGIRGLELLIKWAWDSKNPLLFDVLPLKWLFHAMDLGVLVAFGFYGLISVTKAFRRHLR